MRPRSMARELKGTVKEIVGTCQSVGCTIDGDSATDMLQKVWRAHSRSGLHALAWAGQAPERCICSAAWLGCSRSHSLRDLLLTRTLSRSMTARLRSPTSRRLACLLLGAARTLACLC